MEKSSRARDIAPKRRAAVRVPEVGHGARVRLGAHEAHVGAGVHAWEAVRRRLLVSKETGTAGLAAPPGVGAGLREPELPFWAHAVRER